jgi:acetyltransferase-like isoleucine patch superfamily enzyme
MGSPQLLSSGIRDLRCGDGVKIIEPVNLYECELGDGVFVGPFVEIQRGVCIGARTRVQSHCFVCELVTVGEDCFLGHGVKFVNDAFRIGDRVSIGSNATLLPVQVCSDVVIGAGSVVTRDIDKPGVYAGNPARRLRALP